MKQQLSIIVILLTLLGCVKTNTTKNGWQGYQKAIAPFDTILTREFYQNDTLTKVEKYYKNSKSAPELFASTSFKSKDIKHGLHTWKYKKGVVDSAYFFDNKIVKVFNHEYNQRRVQNYNNHYLYDSTWNAKGVLIKTEIFHDSLNEFTLNYYGRLMAINTLSNNLIDFKNYNNEGKLQEIYLPQIFPSIIKSEANCLFGLKNTKGEWILSPEYEFISEFQNNYAVVGKNGLNGIVDTSGKFIYPLQTHTLSFPEKNDRYFSYDKNVISRIEYYNDSKNAILFQPAGKAKGLIHLKNGKIAKPEYSSINLNFWKSNFIILEKDKFEILIDTLGNILQNEKIKYYINNYYTRAPYFIIFSEKNNKNGIVNTKGKVIIPYKYDNIYDFIIEDSILIAQNKKDSIFDFYNLQGKKTFSKKGNDLVNLYSKRISIKLNKQFNIFDLQGNIINSKIDSIYTFESHILIKKNKEWIIADTNGNNILNEKYESLYSFSTNLNEWSNNIDSEQLLIAKKNGYYGIIDFIGNIRYPFKYKYIDNKILASDSGIEMRYFPYRIIKSYIFNDINGVGLADTNGRFILKPIYKSIDTNSKYIEIKMKDSSVALANYESKIILQGKSERIYKTEEGFAMLEQGISTVYDNLGNKLYSVPGVIVKTYPNFVYIVNNKNKIGVFYKSGEMLIDTLFYQIRAQDSLNDCFWTRNKPLIEVNEDGEELGYATFGEMFWGEWNLHDKTGKIVKSNIDYPSIFCPDDKAMAINFKDSTGILDRNFNWLQYPKKGKTTTINNIFLTFKETTKYSIYDSLGRFKSDNWDDYQVSNYGFTAVFKNKIPSLIDRKGDIIIKGDSLRYNYSRRLINDFIAKLDSLERLKINLPIDEIQNKYGFIYTEYDEIEQQLTDNHFDNNTIDKVFDRLENYKTEEPELEYSYEFQDEEVYLSGANCIQDQPIEYFPVTDWGSRIFGMGTGGRMYQETQYEILNTMPNYISIIEKYIVSARFLSNTESDTIYNFYIENGKITPIKLNELLILNATNNQKLRQIIAKKVIDFKVENKESLCELGNVDYITLLKKFFYISNEGLVLYFGKSEETKMYTGDEEEENVMEILISFDELKPFLKPKSILEKLVEK